MTAKFHSKNIADAAVGSYSSSRSTAIMTAVFAAAVLVASAHAQSRGQAPAKPPAATPGAKPTGAPAVAVVPSPDYLIGADDVLSIVYWKDDTMTRDVTVRPDGRISLPLLNDVQASGLTVTQLGDRLTEESKKFIEDPNVTVVAKQINSRKVSITGEVSKPGVYALSGATTVLDLISLAGGLRDYAEVKKIVVIRTENGKPVSHRFNYKEVASGKNLRQNIDLKPGDMIVVP